MGWNKRDGLEKPARVWMLAAAASVCVCATAAAYVLGIDRARQDVHWADVSAVGFPAYARATLALGVGEPELRDWAARLGGPPEEAERAAVLLGAVVSDASVVEAIRAGAAAVLLARLESRVAAGGRYAVGADVVAARALDERARKDASVGRAMVELAAGVVPHPELAVRVECGAVALAAEYDERVVAFLLAVLRAETPDQRDSPRSWERVTTLAWVKTRAGAALSAAAGGEMRYRPDGSWAHQMLEADRLETLVRRR